MVSPDTKINRKELGELWLDGRDASRALGITVKSLTETVGSMLTRESRSLRGRGARGVGYAYHVEDIERCKLVMQVTGWAALEAARVVWGVRILSEKGKLRNLEAQLSVALPIDLHGHVKRKRARQ